ncbi:MAG: FAD-binding and (Fe-S)-binding domain-containing protein [Bacteroidales bacterium]
MDNLLQAYQHKLKGELCTDKKTRLLYATDASAYRELPLAVALPKDKTDVITLIHLAQEAGASLIPRTAGTSLAGQVVGPGIVVDVSRYMTDILEVNPEEQWVRVQPGVILDELNLFLKDYGLFFGPETSTANRCMIGGMVGNNACGAHSLLYGTTRHHTISVKGFLSDGSEAEFGPLTREEFYRKLQGDSLESKIYKRIHEILSNPVNQKEIEREYPDKSIYRRNTGYSIDLLLDSEIYSEESGQPFNFSRLICGSEGTLMFITEIKLNLVPLPPKTSAVIAAHFNSKEDAFRANLIALEHNPGTVEMMDHHILELTKNNRDQQKNREFVKGDPEAILIIEFARESKDEIERIHREMVHDFQKAGYGYYFPLIHEPEASKVWNLRKAGLGILSNMKGDAKPVSIIEDTAVNVEALPDYMADFQKILNQYDLDCVFYAHIGSGELHLRPILNLKDPKDVEMFRTIGREIAHLVKKYNGSLSGEHGDGRLRGEFIPIILGDKNYQLLKEVKHAWDPNEIFNPGKIVDVPTMNESLRFLPGQEVPEIPTVFDFSDVGGILRATEKCNGSGDCRKTELTGGTMCPSYMATRKENDVTRARANILREFLTHSAKKNRFNHREIYEVMELCLSCKACKTECPSNVDVAKLKAEFLQHYYDANGIPLRTRMIVNINRLNRLGSIWPGLYNFFMKNRVTTGLINRAVGFSTRRSMPLLQKQTLSKWMKRYVKDLHAETFRKGKVYLFNDEFTNYNDTDIGIKTIQLLERLGYDVIIPRHLESGRAWLSKGLVRKAKKIANRNIRALENKITEDTPLVGIEPSAILAFRDEYPDLATPGNKEISEKLASNAFMIDEFLAREMENGNIKKAQFTDEDTKILLHGHCQQKAVASTDPTRLTLSFPENHHVEEIPSGCCGMAGSFGYEKEHYATSMKIGELVLFPAVRAADQKTVIAAPGTSCRHQIMDGTSRKALHPVEVLYHALK